MISVSANQNTVLLGQSLLMSRLPAMQKLFYNLIRCQVLLIILNPFHAANDGFPTSHTHRNQYTDSSLGKPSTQVTLVLRRDSLGKLLEKN